MTGHELCAELRAVHEKFANEAAVRHPDDGRGVEYLLARHLPELMGVPNLFRARPRVASWRNGTLVVLHGNLSHNPTDYIIYGRSITNYAETLSEISRTVVAASAWLRTSPQHRVVLVAQFQGYGLSILAAVAIHCDMTTHRATLPASMCGRVPPRLLHDVLSLVHGRDRLVAAFVCKTWRRATCDFALPVTDDDVRAWVAPRLDELQGALPSYAPTVTDVTAVWMFATRWLQGYD
jgi:hypothetical protein